MPNRKFWLPAAPAKPQKNTCNKQIPLCVLQPRRCVSLLRDSFFMFSQKNSLRAGAMHPEFNQGTNSNCGQGGR
jgi:hypothetical protein